MAEPIVWSILTTGIGPHVAVGERVSVPTSESGMKLEVIPDPEGTFVVLACEPGLIRIQEVTKD